MILGESKRVYVFGDNSHGQLGLGEQSFLTPAKVHKVPRKDITVNIPLQSIKEISMDNSALLRKTDDVSSLKDYINELENKLRETESTKDLMMSETLKFLNQIEKIASEQMRQSHTSYSKLGNSNSCDDVLKFNLLGI